VTCDVLRMKLRAAWSAVRESCLYWRQPDTQDAEL